MVHYRLVILMMDGSTKVTSSKFDNLDAAEASAQWLAQSLGIDEVTVIECRDYITMHNRNGEDLLSALMG